MQGVKGVSSRLVNIHRGVTGINWIDESYDRIMRDKQELEIVVRYIEQNPYKAGLVKEGNAPYPFYYIDEDWM